MIRLRCLSFFALCCAAALGVRCSGLSTTPSAGGGTETGNPGMVACIDALFEETEATGLWSPVTYLPGGTAQLDPTSYLSSGPVIPLAKSLAKTMDTIAPAWGNILRIRSSVDTVVFIDSIFVKDTVLKEFTRNDTTAQDSKFTVVQETKKIDTIIVVDTIVKRDSTLMPRRDTVFLKLVDSANAPVTVVSESVPGKRQIVYLNNGKVRTYAPIDSLKVTFSVRAYAVSYQIQASGAALDAIPFSRTTENFTLKTDSGNVQLARSGAPAKGTSVSEVYGDADGDGYLFKAATGTSPRSRFTGTYVGGDARFALTFLFDAGVDRLFKTVSDNRVFSLSLVKTRKGSIIDKVTYTIPALDTSLDSAVLTHERYPETWNVLNTVVRYACVPGTDQFDQRQNRLGALSKSVWYRSGIVQELSLRFVPDSPMLSSQRYEGGRITATLIYAGARMGTLDATLNMHSGSLGGVYSENGTEYYVNYSRAANTLHWAEKK